MIAYVYFKHKAYLISLLGCSKFGFILKCVKCVAV